MANTACRFGIPLRALAVAILAALGPSATAAAEEAPPVRAARPGQLVAGPEGVSLVERVFLDGAVVDTLLEIPLERSIQVAGWPSAPGFRTDVLLTRHHVYAPGAVVYEANGQALTQRPLSRLVFLWGEAQNEGRSRVVVSVDPDTGALHGYTDSDDGWIEVRPDGDVPDAYLVAPARAFLDTPTEPLGYACDPPAPIPPDSSDMAGSALLQSGAIETLHQATLAVDTDNEFMQLKFADNTTSATNYLASLFALMTAVYERDLLVRLLQGTTILRVSTTLDPYNQSGAGNADSAKLSEFGSYWAANYAAVPRAAAMMLSGKQGSPNSASGIGYLNTLCSSSSGYTFSQVFKFAGSTASSDVLLVAHEAGHNFGSAHTHCYLTPTPIDTCYSGEAGCYSGTTSCPAPMTYNGVTNVTGTLMSYCHLLSGCSASSVFHPRTVAILDPIVQSKVGVCVFPASTPKEASPAGNLTASRGTGTSANVTYAPACGASNHTVYAGSLNTLRTGGIAWSQRYCSFGTSGSLTFDPGSGNIYFVVVGNNGGIEGSYGRMTSGERPPAGAGGACSYTQDLLGTCP